MGHPNKKKGTAAERRHREAYLSRVWPNVTSHYDKRHPTKDHLNTGDWHVESKKRKTWNIADVLSSMEKHVPTGEPWIVLYEDGDKRRAGAIQTDVVILPADVFFDLLETVKALTQGQVEE